MAECDFLKTLFGALGVPYSGKPVSSCPCSRRQPPVCASRWPRWAAFLDLTTYRGLPFFLLPPSSGRSSQAPPAAILQGKTESHYTTTYRGSPFLSPWAPLVAILEIEVWKCPRLFIQWKHHIQPHYRESNYGFADSRCPSICNMWKMLIWTHIFSALYLHSPVLCLR